MKRLLLLVCISSILNASEPYEYKENKFLITTIDSNKKNHIDDVVLTKAEINRLPLFSDLVNDLKTDDPISVPYDPSITKENLHNLIKIVMLMPDEIFVTEDPNRLFIQQNRLFIQQIEKNKIENELSSLKNVSLREEQRIDMAIGKINQDYEKQKGNTKVLYDRLQEARDNVSRLNIVLMTEESRLENVKKFNDVNSLKVVAVEKKIEQVKKEQKIAKEEQDTLIKQHLDAKRELPEESEINSQIVRLGTAKDELKNKAQEKENELKTINIHLKNEFIEKDNLFDEKLKKTIRNIAKENTPQDFLSTLQLVLLANYLKLPLECVDALIDILSEKKVSFESVKEIKRLKSSVDSNIVKKISNATIGIPHKVLYKGGKARSNIAFNFDGTLFASQIDYSDIEIWNTKTWTREKILKNENGVLNFCFSPDGTMLAAGVFGNKARIWDTKTGNCIITFNVGYYQNSEYCQVFFCKDNNELFLVTSSWGDVVSLWNTKTWDQIKMSYPLGKQLFFSNTGLLVTPSYNQQHCSKVRIDNIIDGKYVGELNGFPFEQESVSCIAFNADDTMLATGDEDGPHVRIWDTQTRNCIKVLQNDLSNQFKVYSLIFSPNSQRLACLFYNFSEPNLIQIWDTNNWKNLYSIREHASSVSFDPTGTILASASYMENIKIWYLNTHLTLDQIAAALYCKQHYKLVDQKFEKDYKALPDSVKDMLPKPLWEKTKVKFFEEKKPQKRFMRKLKEETDTQKVKFLSRVSASERIKALKLKGKK